MNTSKHLGASALLLSAGLLTGCFDSGTDNGNGNGNSDAACLEAGTNKLKLNITDALCELEDGTYDLQGVTFVKAGATLKLHPGVTIRGTATGSQTALVVEKGGILHAVGTPTNPILFTPGTAVPERGDFGGVVILGNSQVNTPSGTADIEGLVGVPFGGGASPVVTDSSGHLQYIRIEYAGYLFGADNELNGITFGGVGSRTKVSHIHQYEGLDDCFEWFGGTVSASYLVATGCDDDIFDYDLGWQGTLQFLLGSHVGTTNNDANGIEADGRSGAEESMPRTYGNIANMTLIGNGTSSWNGMRLRRGVGGQIYNSIITGFGTGTPSGVAVRVDGATSARLVLNDSLKGHGIYAYGNGGRIAGFTGADSTAAIAKVNTWFTSISAPLGISLVNPKPATAPAGAVALPTGKGFVPATFIGAFDPAASTLWINEGNWVRKTNWPGSTSTASNCLETGTNMLKLNITDDLCVLEAGTYSLQGVTFVKFGSTLKLNPGVIIRGTVTGSQTALVVEKGGKLHAVGTPSNPIVFTPGTASPERGDFGGVVILGNSQVNTPSGTADIEGLVGIPFGGGSSPVLTDSSGHLQYIRIEYAGYLFGADNELNGITFGGVGSRTKVSHIHQYEGLDDCFEWFGGTVSASYLVASGCDDDIFDYDLGWQGTLQFLLGTHVGVTNNDANGIEADGRNGAEESLPRTYAHIANMTLIGNGTSSWNGMRLRRGVGSQIYNSIVTGFGTGTPSGVAVRVDGNTSIRLVNNDSLKAYGLYAYGNGGRVNVSAAAGLVDSVATRAAAITKINTWFAADTANLGITRTNPKPATAPAGAVALPTGKGFVPATFIGAFDPAASTLWINEGTWVRKTNW